MLYRKLDSSPAVAKQPDSLVADNIMALDYAGDTTIIVNDTVGTYTIDTGTESAILEVVPRRLQVNCSTADCYWDTFNTLGVCQRCSNITAQLKRINN